MASKQKKYKPTVYLKVPLDDELYDLIEAQADAVNDELLAKFMLEVMNEKCKILMKDYEGQPQCTIIGVGRGEGGGDVGISGTGDTPAEAFLVAYMKVTSGIDYMFYSPGGDEKNAAPRWG
jgi:hypothetical protein